MNKVPDADIVLTKGRAGIFDIIVDDDLRYSKGATGRFPSDAEVTAALNA